MAGPTSRSPGDDVTHAPTVIGVLVATTIVAMICLAARLYTRCKILRTPGMDDVILLANMFIFIMPNLIATGIQIRYGLGRHIYYLDDKETLLWFKWAFIGDAFGIFMPAIPKFGVVVLLDRCLGKYRQRSLRALYALVIFLLIMTILNICFIFFQCRPVYAPWTAGVAATCWDPRIVVGFSYFVAAFSAFVDLILALYPLTFLWKLQIAPRRKLGTMFIMGLGVVACGCAVVRTTTLGSISHSDDATWNSAALVLWCGTEANVITICASIPAIMPLFHHMKCPGRACRGEDDSASQFTDGKLDSSATTTTLSCSESLDASKILCCISTTESGRSLHDRNVLNGDGQILANTTTEVPIVRHDQP